MDVTLRLEVLSVLAAAGVAVAHLSFAPYDIRNPIEIEGVAEHFVDIRP
jgi:hypothetical protein